MNLPEGCWEWQGADNNMGYGIYRRKMTHRFAWEMFYGPIPRGLWVLHRCDNKVCVNPLHLFLGTAKDNVADMYSKGRQFRPDGEAHGMNKITEDQAREIIKLYRSGNYLQKEIAAMFGITQAHVSRFHRFSGWKNKRVVE